MVGWLKRSDWIWFLITIGSIVYWVVWQPAQAQEKRMTIVHVIAVNNLITGNIT
jgi:hypothetical protein